jgi:hypothetical protein
LKRLRGALARSRLAEHDATSAPKQPVYSAGRAQQPNLQTANAARTRGPHIYATIFPTFGRGKRAKYTAPRPSRGADGKSTADSPYRAQRSVLRAVG